MFAEYPVSGVISDVFISFGRVGAVQPDGTSRASSFRFSVLLFHLSGQALPLIFYSLLYRECTLPALVLSVSARFWVHKRDR